LPESLLALCVGLSIIVVAVAAIGVLGAHWSTILGKQIASDELATSTATGELARNMDTAYVTGEEAFLTANPAVRSHLLGYLYTSLLPATDDEVTNLVRLHANDPPAERSDIQRFVRQWLAVRDELSPTSVASHPMATLAAGLSADYVPLGTHLDRLFLVEQAAGQSDQLTQSRPSNWPNGRAGTASSWPSRRSSRAPATKPPIWFPGPAPAETGRARAGPGRVRPGTVRSAPEIAATPNVIRMPTCGAEPRPRCGRRRPGPVPAPAR
jgi:hypothetical protein